MIPLGFATIHNGVELSRSPAYYKNTMGWIRTRTRRIAAIVCLMALAFAQLASAANGCFGSRTSVPASGEACALERLLCYVHCQAEEQSSGGVDLSIPDVADLPPITLVAMTWVVFPSTVFTSATLDTERARPPPPFSVNLRLLN